MSINCEISCWLQLDSGIVKKTYHEWKILKTKFYGVVLTSEFNGIVLKTKHWEQKYKYVT